MKTCKNKKKNWGFWVFKQIEEMVLQEGNLFSDELSYGYDTESMNELMLAVKDNDMDAIKEYAADLSMLNETNSEGYTALHIAVIESNYEAAEYLLEQGTDPNTTRNGGNENEFDRNLCRTQH